MGRWQAAQGGLCGTGWKLPIAVAVTGAGAGAVVVGVLVLVLGGGGGMDGGVGDIGGR